MLTFFYHQTRQLVILFLPILVFAEPPSVTRAANLPPERTTPPMVEGYNASSRIDPCGSWNIFFQTELLYWIPKERGLDFAISDNSSDSTQIVGLRLEPKYSFEPGFRCSLGGYSAMDNWEVVGKYTWIHAHINTFSQANSGGALLMRWFTASPRATTASSTWSLLWNQIDIEMARSFFTGIRLSLRPFVGSRFLWGHQKYHVQAAIADLSGALKSSKNRSKYWSVGPLLGMQSLWYLGKGWNFQGKVGTALIFEKNQVHTEMDDTSSVNPVFDFQLSSIYRDIKPQIDTGLGISWGSYFNNHRWHCTITLDYEFHFFGEENKMRSLVDDAISQISTTPGALYTHGGTFGIQLHF